MLSCKHIPWMKDIKDYPYVHAQPNLIVVMYRHIPWMQDIKDCKHIQPKQRMQDIMQDIKDFQYVEPKPKPNVVM